MLAWKLSSAAVLIASYFLLKVCLPATRGSWIHQDTFSEGCVGWLVPGPASTKAKHVFLMVQSGQKLHQGRKRCLYWHPHKHKWHSCMQWTQWPNPVPPLWLLGDTSAWGNAQTCSRGVSRGLCWTPGWCSSSPWQCLATLLCFFSFFSSLFLCLVLSGSPWSLPLILSLKVS